MDVEENEPSEERENIETLVVISKELKGKCKKMVDRMECCGIGPKIQNIPSQKRVRGVDQEVDSL